MSTSFKQTRRIQNLSSKNGLEFSNIVYGKVNKVLQNTDNILLEGAIEYSAKTAKSLPSLAFPLNYHLQSTPIVGEVVPLYYNETLEKLFYGLPINIHNFPTHNSIDPEAQVHPDYVERTNINPYTSFAGDILFQGRFGQSLRFSQNIENKTPWQGVAGNSVIILSSGQASTEDGGSLLLEDSNVDAASLYLVEDTSISLLDSSKRDSYEEPIESANAYQGNQAILTSDRLYLNARLDSILLSAQSGSVGLSSNEVHIDGIRSIRLDAPIYNLQADTFTTTNQTRSVDSETSTYNFNQFDLNGTNVNVNYDRIGLGEAAAEPLLQSTEFLTDLTALNASLTQLGAALAGVTALLAALPGGQVPAATLQTAANSVISQANNIQTKATSGNYLSTTVFTK